ncbi:carbohydrate sulfotransferase 1-like isoform X2 [Portunus trituberculatus]|nr:carbohydrate sulfotransferase 1-like isoform X2 [Portunus trituberculatus]
MSKYERFNDGVEGSAEEGVNAKSTQQYGATTPAGDVEAPAEPTKKRSLAPRTRQTVRTAVIAVVSALALVAIFHLARLAEHPVSENAIDGSKEQHQKQEQRQMEGGSEAWVGDGVLKAHSGKAVSPLGPRDGWQEAKEMAEQMAVAVGAEGPASPVQDILARSRPGGRQVRPIINVPVGRDVVDIQRIRNINRPAGRPANATEVNMTLSLVRRKVEADRKKLSSKTLRLWSPGEVPLRVLLVTTWRSGSTFLGQVLAHHPAVFNHYEPFSPLGVRQVRSGREAFQSQQLLHRLMDCQYTGQDEYLNYTRSHAEDMLGHNKGIWDPCHRGPNFNTCFNSSFLSQACQMFPIQLVKTVRLRLNLTQLFLNDERMNVKVVFLVRDPRATMSSRYSSVSWCNDNPDCSSPEVLCSDLQGDLKVATALGQLYPQRFKMLKYEDLATDPQTVIKNLMDFLGLEYSVETAQFVKENTEQDVNSPWSIKRKSSDRVNLWKKQLPLQEIHTIQNACESVLKTLEYELVGQ